VKVNLNLPPLYREYVRTMAFEVDTTASEIVSGIVKIFIDNRVQEKKSHSAMGRIKDQHGRVYESVEDACKKLNLHAPLVYCVLRGTRHHTGGYTFSRV
jgi:hypothetical protein